MATNVPAGTVIGSVALDGSLLDWTDAFRIDNVLSVAGYDVYARATGGSLVIALNAPVAIGATSTVWLNTDQNLDTGFQIFGFTGGAEYNVNFSRLGVPRLFTGDEGQNLVTGATVSYTTSADRRVVEMAVPLSTIGSPTAVNTLIDINDEVYLPTAYQLAQYEVITAPRNQVIGSVTLDGNLSDWTAADQIGDTMSVAGYDIYAKATGGSLAFALVSPVPVGPHTTAWLNTDQNATTGFQIFGFAGGAEYNIDFDIAGTPRLYTGNAGQTPVPGTVSYGANGNRTIVEFAVPLAAIGSPEGVNTLWDVNDLTFLPTAFQLAQYEVVVTPRNPVVGSVTLDGSLADWTAADQIDDTLDVAGFDIFAKATGDSLVFALHAPVAIGPRTTAWLDTDQNEATGFQIFGFAGGAEFNVDFDVAGTPRLYTGNAGQTLVPGAVVSYGASFDRTIVEFAVPLTAIGSPAVVNTWWDVNDATSIPTSFQLAQYDVVIESSPPVEPPPVEPPPVEPPPVEPPPPGPVVGPVTIDGNLSDWTAADLIDQSLSVAGYDIYARGTAGSYVFAVDAPVAIGASTTAWLNTDENAATGYQIFGFAGGAEYNVNFDVDGVPRLYVGNSGELLVPGVTIPFAYSADRTTVEFAVDSLAISDFNGVINTLWDVNDLTFLPSAFFATQYPVHDTTAPARVIGAVTLDGNLTEWSVGHQIDQALSVTGYDIYARPSGGAMVFALHGPSAIGAHTTAWLNTDANTTTGFQVFGDTVGAEFNVNFDQSGTPHLYTGDAGQTLRLNDVFYAYNADHTNVEFAVPLTALGSPATVQTSWDVNNSVFLPTAFSLMQYAIETLNGSVSTVNLV